MDSFSIIQSPLPEENNEFTFKDLYLYHVFGGPSRNQTEVSSGDAATRLDVRIAVNNWEISDGPDAPSSTIVARAQGMHVYIGNKWVNDFSIVFEDERHGLKGSTLQVRGFSVDDGEFAIVGGTGKFCMATGVITKTLDQWPGGATIVKLNIQVFSPSLEGRWLPPPSPVTKIEQSFGGDGGVLQDIDIVAEKPGRLESITVHSGVVIDALEFSYADQAGKNHTHGPWGGSRNNPITISLAPNEFVTGISGTYGFYRSCIVVASLTFATNLNTHGPYGLGDGTPFTIPVQDNNVVVGFFGRSSKYLDAIGVYVRPQ